MHADGSLSPPRPETAPLKPVFSWSSERAERPTERDTPLPHRIAAGVIFFRFGRTPLRSEGPMRSPFPESPVSRKDSLHRKHTTRRVPRPRRCRSDTGHSPRLDLPDKKRRPFRFGDDRPALFRSGCSSCRVRHPIVPCARNGRTDPPSPGRRANCTTRGRVALPATSGPARRSGKRETTEKNRSRTHVRIFRPSLLRV